MRTTASTDKTQPVLTRRPRPKNYFWLKVWLLRFVMTVIFFGGWELIVRLNLVNGFFFGQPSRILAEFNSSLADMSLLRHSWVTMSETLIALFPVYFLARCVVCSCGFHVYLQWPSIQFC